MPNPVSLLPALAEDDRRLLEQAACLLRADHGSNLSQTSLRELAAAQGIDLATAVVYQQIRSTAPHAAFIEEIESSHPLPEPLEIPLIVIVPGAFHISHPQSGADGALVYELAGMLGWPVEKVPLKNLGSMAQNGAALVEFLSRRPGKPMILVSLSKGGADVVAALARPRAAQEMRDVRAWVNVSGIIRPTPLIAWFDARPLRKLAVHLLMCLRGQRIANLDELGRSPDSPLQKPLRPPPAMRVIHVLGFAQTRCYSNDWARRGHARLAELGPNDGGGIMLHHAASLPGQVYPVWGADHYLKPPWDIRPLLLRVLRHATIPSSPPLI